MNYNFDDENCWQSLKDRIMEKIPAIPSDGTGETYNEWLKMCLSMKAAGYAREEVNAWCGAEEFNLSRWDGLSQKSSAKDARAHLYNIAKQNGYCLPYSHGNPKNIKWFSYDIMQQETIDAAIDNAKKVIDMLYTDQSYIYMCAGKEINGKLIPDSTRITNYNIQKLTTDKLQMMLRYDTGMYVQLNNINQEAFNEYRQAKQTGSILSEHIISWKYAYVEADPADGEDVASFIASSKQKLEHLDLPWICHIFSGKKSIHTIIRLDASSPEEWKNRLVHIHNYLKKSGYQIDGACKNPNRWERFWCAGRNGLAQYVMAINENTCSFSEWENRHSQPTQASTPSISLLNAKGNINNLAMLQYIEKQGFRAYNENGKIEIIHLDGKFVKKVEKASVINAILKEIVKTESEEIQEKVIAFLKQQPTTFFAMLPLIEISKHTDSQDSVFFYFKNGVLKIESSTATLLPYSAIQGYIWHGQYKSMDRPYIPANVTSGQYEKFIENITGDKNKETNQIVPNLQNMNNACSIIGYLLSRYKDPAKAKAVLLTDRQAEVDGDFSTGGTGKGLFINGL